MDSQRQDQSQGDYWWHFEKAHGYTSNAVLSQNYNNADWQNPLVVGINKLPPRNTACHAQMPSRHGRVTTIHRPGCAL
jgi:hypothetical protein